MYSIVDHHEREASRAHPRLFAAREYQLGQEKAAFIAETERITGLRWCAVEFGRTCTLFKNYDYAAGFIDEALFIASCLEAKGVL